MRRVLEHVAALVSSAVGLLIHESGHVAAAAFAGLRPRIGYRPYALSTQYDRPPNKGVDATITAAGPTVQIAYSIVAAPGRSAAARTLAGATMTTRALYPIDGSDISHLARSSLMKRWRIAAYFSASTATIVYCLVRRDFRLVAALLPSYDLYVRLVRQVAQRVSRATFRVTL